MPSIGARRCRVRRSRQLFAEHDALLFWSPVQEPAPLVAMEAMAAQLPVIVPAPLSPSPIYEDGVTCVTFARRDPAAIAAAIERLAGDAGACRD